MLYEPRDIEIIRKSEFRIEVRIGSLTRMLVTVLLATGGGVALVVALFWAQQKPLPSPWLLFGIPALIVAGKVLLSSRTRLVSENLTQSLVIETRNLLRRGTRVEIPFFQFTQVILFNDPKGELVNGRRKKVWGIGLKNGDLEIETLLFCEDEATMRKIAAGLAQSSGRRVFETNTSGLVVLSRNPADRFRRKLQLIEDAEHKAAQLAAQVEREKARKEQEEKAKAAAEAVAEDE